ncbi:MAG: cellulase, partial [Nocardioides sp.]|nr:cellulase [Nocardioides sp.]
MTINKYLLTLVIIIYGKLSSAQQEQKIAINQLGFYPNASKIAVIIEDVSATSFDIISTKTQAIVYSGKLSETKQSINSSLKTKQANFSLLKKPGAYVIRVKGLPDSYRFNIQNEVNHPAAAASLKGFYFIRSNTPLIEKYAGKWARPAGHPDTEVLVHASAATKHRPEGTVISSPGGWYDAGDYNKYIVNSGISTSTLFSAYEDFPSYFDKLNINIPESDNQIPDILDEAIYNLRWMLTMQDPNDGGVYHKCTNAAFDAMDNMPG